MLSINWKPDKKSSTPIYKQIVDYIKEKIAKGHWVIGTKLPTQRELAKIFTVNRSTIVEAFNELKAEGLIEGQGRKGTRIINNTWSLLTSKPPPNWKDYIEDGIHKPNLPIIQVINKLEFKPDYVRLGTGELSPELFPKKMMEEVLNSISIKFNSLGYEEPKGNPYLRKVISQDLKKFGIKTNPDSILIVSGSLQALQLISIGILHPGSTVFIERPSYLKSLHVFQSTGMNLKGLKMDSKGISLLDIIKNTKGDNTKLLYTIPTFHNPTGIVMSADRRDKLKQLCEQKRLPIIEDNVYGDLWIDDKPPVPLKAKDKNGSVLYLGSTSKSLAPGLRIGWLVGPENIIDRLGDIKMQTDYGSSSLSQWAVAEWLSSGLYQEHLNQVREKLKLRRNFMLDILDKHFKDIATWNEPKGGFYIWLKLLEKVSIKKLFSQALDEGLLINPGKVYDFSDNQSLRLSYSYASLEDLEWGLKKLAKLIRKFN